MTAEQFQTSGSQQCFVLRPNIGLYWRTTLRVYIILSAVCLGIALGFAVMGFWPILPFAGLEVAALGAALYVSAKRGDCQEVVRIGGDVVEIEKGVKGPEQSWRFPRAWSEVVLNAPLHRWYPSRLVIRSRGTVVELGAFLTDEERELLATELYRCIGPMADRGGPLEPWSSSPEHTDYKQKQYGRQSHSGEREE